MMWSLVRSPAEILKTLDETGATDGLTFMPEMIRYVGQRLTVSRKLEKTCVDASPDGMREFRGNDVVFLEELRCDGTAHGGCGRACMLFWKSAWLKPARGDAPEPPEEAGLELLRRRLMSRHEDGRYRCQSSDLDGATKRIGRLRRLKKCVTNVRVGNHSAIEMAGLIVKPMLVRMWIRFFPRWPSGPLAKTPAESLNLQPGDWVEVKSVAEITATLDASGKNRGLQFAYDLARCCGKRFKVRNRLEHMVIERTGKSMDVRNTVLLEGVTCPCRCVIGGCVRADYIYWREIWLRKVPAPDGAAVAVLPSRAPAACCQGSGLQPITVGGMA